MIAQLIIIVIFRLLIEYDNKILRGFYRTLIILTSLALE